MQDHFSQLTSMIKKNMDTVNNLRLALQKKKERYGIVHVCKSQCYDNIILTDHRHMVGGEFETQASEDVLMVDKSQHHRGPGTYNNYYMMSDFHVSQHTQSYYADIVPLPRDGSWWIMK